MAAALALAARAAQAANRTNPWTKVSLQDYTWSEVSTLEVAVCNEMHLVGTTAKLRVEKSAQTTSRLTPIRYRTPHKILVRGYQLPGSATRWQHWSKISFETFLVKITKLIKNSVTTQAREKISTHLESLEF